jgi:superfamily I DNA and/or RNA helicase
MLNVALSRRRSSCVLVCAVSPNANAGSKDGHSEHGFGQLDKEVSNIYMIEETRLKPM